MAFLKEAIDSLKQKGIKKTKVTRLDESIIPEYDSATHASAFAQRLAISIVKEATRAVTAEWRKNSGVRRHWSSKRDYVEDTVRDLAEEIMRGVVKDLDDEVDVALSHIHGI